MGEEFEESGELEGMEWIEEVAIPNQGDTEFGQSLLSEGIEEVIAQKKITNVLLKDTDEIITPSYLIDFSNCDTALASTLDTISMMLLDYDNLEEVNRKRAERGDIELTMDTALYIKGAEGIVLAGMGDGYVMYRQLESFIMSAFEGRVKVYKNNGKGFAEAKRNDATSVKLRLA